MQLSFGNTKISDEVDEIEEENLLSNQIVEFELKPKSKETL